MKLAFVLYKYFPFGGLQRDMLRIALQCQQRGHEIHVFCLSWQGEVAAGLHIHERPIKRLMNYQSQEAFARRLPPQFERLQIDGVIGFNRMPGLDLYFGADSCFKEMRERKGRLWRVGPRYEHFLRFEEAVFSPRASTRLLMISAQEIQHYIHHYHTPRSRFHLLPPGIAADRRRPVDYAEIRTRLRAEWKLAEDDFLLLMVGSGFRTKGVDRSIHALVALPDAFRKRARLFVIGQDNPRRYEKLAERLKVAQQVQFTGGRDDIPACLQAADVLLHPALFENTGSILLEATVAGLPVLTTDSCAYASHVRQADAGVVLESPFRQRQMNRTLQSMLADDEARSRWSDNGADYGRHADVYSMPQLAADIIVESIGKKLAHDLV
ncbi:MAG: glycosyltransferase family 4 protein [gamma proteobacterium symbiont of Bathyaustriella thionipta]|nr:glycosyltransferase family 4 protein [gamma proteobacterium symbiont of Bathyaustriella thionipta]